MKLNLQSAIKLAVSVRGTAIIVFAVTASLFFGALIFQYCYGLKPCVLCIYQRWPHVIAAVVSAVAIFVRKEQLATVLTSIAGFVVLIGAGIAFFHVGVEYHWWTYSVSCVTETEPGGTAEQLVNMLSARSTVPCDVPQWSLFGITMAGYNFIISLGLGLFALATPLLRRRFFK